MALTSIVDESPHAPPFTACHKDVADLQCAALDQHCCDGAAASLELCFEDDAFRRALRVRCEIE